jgi:hypothetical protein
MQLKEVVYQKRPLKVELDITTSTLIDIMNTAAASAHTHWSFSGGFARDLYLNHPWNDYDICSSNQDGIASYLDRMGVLEKGTQENNEIPHDYFVDPYSFTKEKYPIHWIHAYTPWAYAPQNFDFSINQICLKPDGYFYAPSYTWRDLDKKVIRKTTQRMSPNISMRACRFSSKYGFSIHPELLDEIKSTFDKPMDTIIVMRNAQKMLDDDVGPQSLAIMKEIGFPKADECETIEDFIKLQNDLIVSGQGYLEPNGDGRYNDW